MTTGICGACSKPLPSTDVVYHDSEPFVEVLHRDSVRYWYLSYLDLGESPTNFGLLMWSDDLNREFQCKRCATYVVSYISAVQEGIDYMMMHGDGISTPLGILTGP